MSETPIIGIPCRLDVSAIYKGRPIHSQNTAYIEAVIQAGGIPLLVPVNPDKGALRKVYDRLDGVLLAGGGDVDPVRYGETKHETVMLIEDERDQVELAMTRWAIDEEKPLFGVCRGIQVMAVATGGTLWQDLPSQVPAVLEEDYTHSNGDLPRNTLVHEVELLPGSQIAEITGESRIAVNSLHHQAVKQAPSGYEITGRSQDGVIEVIEQPDHQFCLGVQWHPEEMVKDEASARKLFAAFVEACKG
ncbi:MAG: gamma-glutamyl-gamma-aminobutyrate hydrolase family protein [Chloroflexota bacterium]